MSEKQKEYRVDGFVFREEELYQQAKREAEGIRYIRNKTNMDNPKMVFQVYQRIIEQKLFETTVGIGYLRELQEYLMVAPGISPEEIVPIPVEEVVRQEFVPVRERKVPAKKQSSGALRLSVAGNIVLVLLVIAMFILTLTSRLPNILNYEENLLNKYSAWEEQLQERERQIQLRESELGTMP